jgi:hypothetical protein
MNRIHKLPTAVCCTHSHLLDIAYYFTKGAELMSLIDSSHLDPMIAQMVENIRPFASRIDPHAKRLWFHLEQE